jgi:hypothetical protein
MKQYNIIFMPLMNRHILFSTSGVVRRRCIVRTLWRPNSCNDSKIKPYLFSDTCKMLRERERWSPRLWLCFAHNQSGPSCPDNATDISMPHFSTTFTANISPRSLPQSSDTGPGAREASARGYMRHFHIVKEVENPQKITFNFYDT